jgi:hypothetical protein
MVSGLTEMEAVGEGGGGGGGGGGGAAFFLQAPSMSTALSAMMVATDLKSLRFMLIPFTLNPPASSKSVSSSDEVFYFQLQFGCELRPVKVN